MPARVAVAAPTDALEAPSRRRTAAAYTLTMLAVAFAGDSVGVVGRPLGTLVGIGACWAAIQCAGLGSRWRRVLPLLPVVVALALAPRDLQRSAAARVGVCVLSMLLVAGLLSPRRRSCLGPMTLAAAAGVAAALMLEFPAGLGAADRLAIAFSHASTAWSEPSLAAAESYVPLLPFVAAATLAVSHAAARRSGARWRACALQIAAFVAVYALYVSVLRVLPPAAMVYPEGGMFAADFEWPAIGAVAAGTLPPLALSAGVALASGFVATTRLEGAAEDDARWLDRRRRAATLGIVGAAAVLACLLALRGGAEASAPRRPRLVLYERGMVNWMKPTDALPGEYGIGMLGVLPDFASRMGFATEMTGDLATATLDSSCVLAVFNLDHDLGALTFERLRRFVRDGGSLLLVGDHTFHRGADEILMNRLLEDTGIRLNFDTANFFIGGWLRSYRLLRTPLGMDLDVDYNRIGVVTGCSLAVEHPAWAAVVGKFGYSDPGDDANAKEALLGDMRYGHGERLGDVPLVACQAVGSGKVLVCGDTTPFINELLPASHEFLNRSLTWLARRDESAPPPPERLGLAAAALLALIFGAAAAAGRATKTALLSALVGVTLSAGGADGGASSTVLGGRLAVIDRDCFPDVPVESGGMRGVAALRRELVRRGFVTVEGSPRLLEHTTSPRVWVVVAPTTIPDGWVERITRFAEEGGLVIVAAGRDQRAVIGRFLETNGVAIGNTPLGPVAASVARDPTNVTFVEAWELRPRGRDVEIVLRAMESPVVVRRPVGRGTLVVVGDARFLGNENLEVGDRVRVGTIRLIDRLLREYEARLR